MKALPSSAVAYKRTPTFTEETVPAGLLKAHTTKEGAWGRIVVLEGQLLYRTLKPQIEEILLSPEQPGVVEPQVPHEVEPVGAVQFFVEFLRVEETRGAEP